jgi:hypothetical protein
MANTTDTTGTPSTSGDPDPYGPSETTETTDTPEDNRTPQQIAADDTLTPDNTVDTTEVDNLVSSVQSQTSVSKGATTLIAGLKAMLDSAGADGSKLRKLTAALNEKGNALADALLRNTAAESLE